MTDDPHGPAAGPGGPATTGGEPVVDPAAPASGSGRRTVVYLVPTISNPPETDSSGATTLHVQDGDLAGHEGYGIGGASPEPPGALDPDRDLPAELSEREDWAWVQEWRVGQEPTPWATGIALAAFSALIVGVAVWVLSAGLADRPVIAVLVNLLVAAGLTPAIWLSRGLPVLRWIAGGAAVGIIVGWVSAILMLPLPAG